MKAEDFVYDGQSLSSFGYMIADFEDNSGLGSIDTDSQRSFSNFTTNGGKWQPLAFSNYRDALKITISIIKNPCETDDLTVSLTDIRLIKRWLNRPTFHRLRLICSDGEYDNIFWRGSANVDEIHHLGVCVGFTATFYTDSPFALADTIVYSGEVAENGTVIIKDVSDEEGYLYPDVELTIGDAGNLEIVNDFDGRKLVLNDCRQGEVITMTKTLQISSDDPSHKISDDFNWRFLRICNNYKTVNNGYTFSLPCQYKIKYNPIVKAVIG